MTKTVVDLLTDEALETLSSSDEFYKKVRNMIGRKILYENQAHEKNIVEHECESHSLQRFCGISNRFGLNTA